mmetsp:Transcript_5579/g.12827  ORF Transcript_5579/g.12827 Transcript_5579/m.12827 type:complete len:231 (-) Transcript_5579:10-702(-)
MSALKSSLASLMQIRLSSNSCFRSSPPASRINAPASTETTFCFCASSLHWRAACKASSAWPLCSCAFAKSCKAVMYSDTCDAWPLRRLAASLASSRRSIGLPFCMLRRLTCTSALRSAARPRLSRLPCLRRVAAQASAAFWASSKLPFSKRICAMSSRAVPSETRSPASRKRSGTNSSTLNALLVCRRRRCSSTSFRRTRPSPRRSRRPLKRLPCSTPALKASSKAPSIA